MTEPLYRKRGRRYYPVAWHSDEIRGLMTEGCYLVEQRADGVRTRSVISPDRARLLAAARVMQDAMVAAMMKESKLRPAVQEMTHSQYSAWKAFKAEMGDGLMLERPSVYAIVEAVIVSLEAAFSQEKPHAKT
jgi:hypothetical protein